MNKIRKILKAAAWLIGTPVILFLLFAILIYIPPFQQFAVNKAGGMLSESMGVKVEVGKVRLAFPLDLALHNTVAVETAGDTLLQVRAMRLGVQMLPLLKGRADIDELAIFDAEVDTRSFVSDVRVKGRVAELSASSHGVDWAKEFVRVDHVTLRGATLDIQLGDTAQPDTAVSRVAWIIEANRAEISDAKLRVRMPGDSLCLVAAMGKAQFRGGRFDLGRGSYALRSLLVSRSSVQYDLPFAPSMPRGIDPAHLSISNLGLSAEDALFTEAGVVRLDLRRLMFEEKSGIRLSSLSGKLEKDSLRLRLSGGKLLTPTSRLTVEANIDLSSFTPGKGGASEVTLGATLSPTDLRTLACGYLDETFLRQFPNRDVALKALLRGSLDQTRLDQADFSVPGVLQARIKGQVRDIMQDYRAGKLNAELDVENAAPVLALLPKDAVGMVGIPAGTKVRASIHFSGDDYDLTARANTGGGILVMKGGLNLTNERYRLDATARRLPLDRLLPGMGLDVFSGYVKASGRYFDFLSPRTSLHAEAHLQQFSVSGYDLSGIRLHLSGSHGNVKGGLVSENPALVGSGTLTARLGRDIEAELQMNVPVVDLCRLGVTEDSLQVGSNLQLSAATNRSFTRYSAKGMLTGNHFTTPRISVPMKDVSFDLGATPDTTRALVSSGDLYLAFGGKDAPERLAAGGTRFLAEVTKQWEGRVLDQNVLKDALPPLDVYLVAGRSNPLYGIARHMGYNFNSAYLNLGSNPDSGLHGEARIGAFNTGSLEIDTLHFDLLQDTTGVKLRGEVRNYRKLNPHRFTANLDAFLLSSGLGVELRFFDKDGDEGVRLGVRGDLINDGLQLRLFPEYPVLAYRKFKVNEDNYIHLGKGMRVQAALDLLADDGTGLKLYSHPNDSTNDLTLSLNRVNLAELSTVTPYLPPMDGLLTGDFHIMGGTEGHDLSTMVSCVADGFGYEGVRLGNLGVDAIYLPKKGGEHHASAFVSVAEEEVMSIEGTYFDSDGGSFVGNAGLHGFPIQMLNAFMVGTDIALSGRAGGSIDVSGTPDRPVLNGHLDLDSAHVFSEVYGFDFRTDERALDIKDSRLLFEDYNLYSTGKEPLVLNGSLDMSNLSRIGMDFAMKAKNFELINTRKKARSMVFGKVYTNYQGTLRGTLENLSIRGRLEVLDRTNMTYILKDSPLTVEDRLNDLVQFVSFEDSTAIVPELTPQMKFDMSLGISISDAARFHCDLSEDGQSYADLEGGGDLTFRYTESGEMRLTGRFTANDGEMKYALPIIPLKKFKLQNGSYVEFTGDPMNPTLSIAAKERVKAVVSNDDRQRSVAFDVGVALSKPLDEMGLEFTIEAPEDLAVQNELTAMSKEQRGKAAVAMLATGMYMTDETMMSGSGFKAGNALNAFLQSEIQNIAGSALKTIDINLGVESGTSSTGTATTDYSFQFSKRFWGDRFSVIVGGKVSTGADAENSAESFINNVSVEYRLDRSATRYVRVFYDRETQDPLEGQLMKTGAGLVLRRKTNKLGELFLFRKK